MLCSVIGCLYTQVLDVISQPRNCPMQFGEHIDDIRGRWASTCPKRTALPAKARPLFGSYYSCVLRLCCARESERSLYPADAYEDVALLRHLPYGWYGILSLSKKHTAVSTGREALRMSARWVVSSASYCEQAKNKNRIPPSIIARCSSGLWARNQDDDTGRNEYRCSRRHTPTMYVRCSG